MIKYMASLTVLLMFTMYSMQQKYAWKEQHPNFKLNPTLVALCTAALYCQDDFINAIKNNVYQELLPAEIIGRFVLIDKGIAQLNEPIVEKEDGGESNNLLHADIAKEFVDDFVAFEALVFIMRFSENSKIASLLTKYWSEYAPNAKNEEAILNILQKGANTVVKKTGPYISLLDSLLLPLVQNNLSVALKAALDCGVPLQLLSGHFLVNAAKDGFLKIVIVLLEEGVHPDIIATICQRQFGECALVKGPALYFAAKNGHADVVKCLLAYGADPLIGYNNGSIMEIALQNQHDTIVDLLKRAISDRSNTRSSITECSRCHKGYQKNCVLLQCIEGGQKHWYCKLCFSTMKKTDNTCRICNVLFKLAP